MHRVLRVLNVLAATDHEKLPHRLGVMTKFLLEKNVLFAQTWLAYTSICLSGGNIADILRTEFGNDKVSYMKLGAIGSLLEVFSDREPAPALDFGY